MERGVPEQTRQIRCKDSFQQNSGVWETQNIETLIKDASEDRVESPKEQERKLKLSISRKIKVTIS